MSQHKEEAFETEVIELLKANGYDEGTSKNYNKSLALYPELFNADTQVKYEANILRVVRQLYYSEQNKNSIDLELFLNGIPIATIELKTDFTQAVEIAKSQYKTDRLPKGEPLLEFKKRALVHFVSLDEMQTLMILRVGTMETIKMSIFFGEVNTLTL